VNVRILEIDGERRRLSLSLKRVEEGDEPVPRADGAASVHTMPDLKLSEEAFPTATAAAVDVEEGEEESDVSEDAGEDAATEDVAEDVVAEVELEEVDVEVEPAEEPAASDDADAAEPGSEPDSA
jgi:small subunit ribosomal protein S1